MLHGAKMAKTIKVEMKTVSRGIYTLLVSAAPDAAPSPDYQVRFTGKGDYIMVPLEIQVIDPKNPPHLPDKDRQNHL